MIAAHNVENSLGRAAKLTVLSSSRPILKSEIRHFWPTCRFLIASSISGVNTAPRNSNTHPYPHTMRKARAFLFILHIIIRYFSSSVGFWHLSPLKARLIRYLYVYPGAYFFMDRLYAKRKVIKILLSGNESILKCSSWEALSSFIDFM